MADVTNKWSGKNPWLGLGSYSEGQKLYGRDREIEALTEIINNNPAIVLYGKSGIGKSSLLKAGVFPQIRQNAMVPVYIRLTHNTETSYSQQIESAVSEAMTAHDQMPASVPDLGLWDFMHRHRFTDAAGNRVTPVVVLDQFEEIFTLTDADHKSEIPKLFVELADVLNDIKPDKVIQAEANLNKPTESKGTESSTGFVIQAPTRKTAFNYDTSPQFRFVFSIRDDSLYLLERNCAKIPALKVNRFNLNALDEANAMDVITKPAPGLFTHEEAQRILDDLAYYEYDDYRVVDPAILSLFLFSYYREQGKVSYDDIFEQYYQENTQPKLIKETSVSYIEDNLLTERGNRNQVPLEDLYAAGVTIDELKQLLDSKILKTEKRKGTEYVEFSHDRLCEQALKHRQDREAREQARKNRRRLLYVLLGSLAALALVSFYFWQNSRYGTVLKQKQEIARQNQELSKQMKIIEEKNDSITILISERTSQRDELRTLNDAITSQSDSLRNSDEKNKKLNKALMDQKNELEKTLKTSNAQKESILKLLDIIKKQRLIISQYGNCFVCGGTGFTDDGQMCSQCEGSGHIFNTEVVSGNTNTVIQLKKVRPKDKK